MPAASMVSGRIHIAAAEDTPVSACRFIEHGTQADQLEEAGLTAWHIAHTALSLLGRKKDVAAIMSSLRAR